MKNILLVDDEKNLLRVVSLSLEKYDFKVDTALSAEKAFKLFKIGYYDVILCDLKLKDMSGMDLLSEVKKTGKDTIFIVITAYGSIKQAVDAMKLGADDFISKPVDIEGLVNNINILLNKKNPAKDNFSENEALPKIKENFIFESPIMKSILKEIYITAHSNSNVLITGETGTGKEIIAKIIHELSGKEGEFIPINCSAIPSDLLESELFGHEKGSFTGAVTTQKGKFEAAFRGTLFLDEIGEMPVAMQAKLLRVIQDMEFTRLGSSQKIRLDARVISVTNIDLEEAVINKTFREDLFYRINVLHFKIPPLRERKEDIVPLANFFIRKYSVINKKNIKSMSNDVIKALLEYKFPGNVRELENVIERAVIVSPYDTLEASSFPKTIVKAEAAKKEFAISANNNIKLDHIEMELIRNALDKNNYNQTKAAMSLGISRKQLRTKMKKYDLFH